MQRFGFIASERDGAARRGNGAFGRNWGETTGFCRQRICAALFLSLALVVQRIFKGGYLSRFGIKMEGSKNSKLSFIHARFRNGIEYTCLMLH